MSDERQRAAAALKRARRFSQVLPLPGGARGEWRILSEHAPLLGVTLWQHLRDVMLWTQVPPPDRPGFFHPFTLAQVERLSLAAAEAPELTTPLHELSVVAAAPGLADKARVAAACESVHRWAEVRGLRETALQFAEAAARVELDRPFRSELAGRMCRGVHDFRRASLWYRRASWLARREGEEAGFAFAQLGLGSVAHDQGRLDDAERHYRTAARAALRQGRPSVAGAAHHDLLGVAIAAGRYAEAVRHAELAIRLYPDAHPRIPGLAYDVGFLWMQAGHFSHATYLIGRARPWFEAQPLHILMLATLARLAAVVGDAAGYDRASAGVLEMVAAGNERAAASLYHLAEGARCLGAWEEGEALAHRALDEAGRTGNGTVVTAVAGLLAELALRRREPAEVPPVEAGVVERTTREVVEKLSRQPAPGSPGAVLFPECFPVD